MEKLTEQEAHEMIAGKLTRYFGVSAKEATREQISKASEILSENKKGKGKACLLSLYGIPHGKIAEKQYL